MTLETLGLPDGYIDRVHAVPSASDEAGDDHLDLFGGRSLKDGTDDHDPAANTDGPFAAKTIGSHEGEDGTDEAADVINAGNNSFLVAIWVVEVMAEGVEADDGSKHTLIIAKQLQQLVSNMMIQLRRCIGVGEYQEGHATTCRNS